MTAKCGRCGKFSVVVDSYTPFGGYSDIDPPEEIFLCKKCVEEEVSWYKDMGMMPAHWIKAEYEEKLAKELGYVWEVEAYCAWGKWVKI